MSDFYAGLISGLVSTFVCNPFDVIRTNIQLNNKVNYSLSFLYRGIYTGLVTIPSYWSIYFYSYQKLKEKNSNSYTSFINGYIASNFSSTITCPLWFIKQKTQTMPINNSNKHFFDFVKHYKQYGITPFYNGLVSTYFINASFLIQMPVYEKLKLSPKLNELITNDTVRIFIITGFAKTVASCVFYPMDTVRAIKRDSTQNYVQIINKLNKLPLNYYSGLRIYLIRSIPYHATTFCTFEFCKGKINKT